MCKTSFCASIIKCYSNSNQYTLTSTNDEQVSVDTSFDTIQQLERSSFDELASIVTSNLAGVLPSFDQSGAKFALLDSEWNSQPENIIAGPPAAIRPRPNPPLKRILAGPPPVLPIGILNATEIKLANLQLNYHNAAVYREKESNLLCTKYAAIMQYAVSAILNSFNFNQKQNYQPT